MCVHASFRNLGPCVFTLAFCKALVRRKDRNFILMILETLISEESEKCQLKGQLYGGVLVLFLPTSLFLFPDPAVHL